ncbi:MAG: transcription antitermination factor NusB [Candidatus Delongbacteria bacterium]|nr:transcription antitermination factor NusB [Candidatus Delongbacteria bacterium]
MNKTEFNKKSYTPRRRSRIYALECLFCLELNPDHPDQTIRDIALMFPDKESIYEFCREIVLLTSNHLEQIDTSICSALTNWNIDRLSVIDKNIIRMSIAELIYLKTIPPEVTINEAIELGRLFGNEDSPKFINAILDTVAKKNNLMAKTNENRDHQ